MSSKFFFECLPTALRSVNRPSYRAITSVGSNYRTVTSVGSASCLFHPLKMTQRPTYRAFASVSAQPETHEDVAKEDRVYQKPPMKFYTTPGQLATKVFAASQDLNVTIRVYNELATLLNSIEDAGSFAEVASPGVSSERISTFINEYSQKQELHYLTTHVLKTLAFKRKIGVTPRVLEDLGKLIAVTQGEVAVKVTVASKSDMPSEAEIIDKFGLQQGSKIIATTEVDPGLIGGYIITTSDKIMDSSLRGDFKRLEDAIKADWEEMRGGSQLLGKVEAEYQELQQLEAA